MYDWAVKLFLPYLVFLGLGNSTVSLYLKIWPDKKGEHEGWWLAEYCGEGVWFFFPKNYYVAKFYRKYNSRWMMQSIFNLTLQFSTWNCGSILRKLLIFHIKKEIIRLSFPVKKIFLSCWDMENTPPLHTRGKWLVHYLIITRIQLHMETIDHFTKKKALDCSLIARE